MLGRIFGRDRYLVYRLIKEADLSFEEPFRCIRQSYVVWKESEIFQKKYR